MPHFVVVYHNTRGSVDVQLFEADDSAQAQNFVDDVICEGGGKLISLEQIFLPESTPGTVNAAWQAVVDHSIGLGAAMDDRTTFSEVFAFFYLRGYIRRMDQQGILDAKAAWCALVSTDGGWLDPAPVASILAELDDNHDIVNAVRAILNVSIRIESPLPYNGLVDDPYKEAILSLAEAAGVDDVGNLPT